MSETVYGPDVEPEAVPELADAVYDDVVDRLPDQVATSSARDGRGNTVPESGTLSSEPKPERSRWRRWVTRLAGWLWPAPRGRSMSPFAAESPEHALADEQPQAGDVASPDELPAEASLLGKKFAHDDRERLAAEDAVPFVPFYEHERPFLLTASLWMTSPPAIRTVLRSLPPAEARGWISEAVAVCDVEQQRRAQENFRMQFEGLRQALLSRRLAAPRRNGWR